jgi:hypothetical protein
MKTVVLIDGGHLRAVSKSAGKTYDNKFIVDFAALCTQSPEYLFRVFYYDSPRYRGTVSLPVSGQSHNFQASDRWLVDLAKAERFAVRRGTMAFRGWRPKNTPISGRALTDNDFAPIFEQKGVDMRIGLDIASFADQRTVERIVLVSADTDMTPAMKHARKSGLEVVIVQLPVPPALTLHNDLACHADIIRGVGWP